MAEIKSTHAEKENIAEAGGLVRTDTQIDQDRDTFLPRPSDDPNDPLNWPMYLKVGLHFGQGGEKSKLILSRERS